MPHLFLPPKVARELIEERRQYGADLDLVCSTDDTCKRWTRELRRLDPLLRMVRAPFIGISGLPLHPGCYHILRNNENAPVTVTPICTPDGGFMEPPGSLLEEMKGMDLQDVHVRMARQRRIAAAEAGAAKEKQDATDRRIEIAMDKWRAGTQTRINFDPDHRWTQNRSATGRRGASTKDKA